MDICRSKDGLEISELDPFLAELLRQIPASTSTENSNAARDRIFTLPGDPSQKELCKEWKAYVEPELQRLFRSATETVSSALPVPLSAGSLIAFFAKSLASCTSGWLNG